MKILCTKESFLSGLQKVQNIVPVKTTLPILANVLLEAESDKLTLMTTDLEVGIRCTIAATIEKEGSTTIPVKRLLSIFRELPSGDVTMEVDENHTTTITTGTSYFKILGIARTEFPKLPEFKENLSIEIEQEALRDIIRKTAYSISTDETRYVLNGLYVLMKGKTVTAVATDGRRLAMIEKPQLAKDGVEAEFIVPAKVVNELSRMLKGEGNVTVWISKNQVAFELDSAVVVSRLIEGRFPDYKQVIPKTSKEEIILSREELLSATKRVALVTNDKTHSVKFAFSKNRLQIMANTPEVGEAKEWIDVPYGGDDVEIAFNPQYLIDVLKNLEEEEVTLGVTDALKPGVVRNAEAFTYVIMPMRVS